MVSVAVSHKLAGFPEITEAHSDALHGKLSEVLMAQDFQDLAGQIIRQVITLIRDMEDKLERLVRISRGPEGQSTAGFAATLEGSAVPGIDQCGQVKDQDAVEDLLSSLGF